MEETGCVNKTCQKRGADLNFISLRKKGGSNLVTLMDIPKTIDSNGRMKVLRGVNKFFRRTMN
jgi:hypothetical protein